MFANHSSQQGVPCVWLALGEASLPPRYGITRRPSKWTPSYGSWCPHFGSWSPFPPASHVIRTAGQPGLPAGQAHHPLATQSTGGAAASGRFASRCNRVPPPARTTRGGLSDWMRGARLDRLPRAVSGKGGPLGLHVRPAPRGDRH